MMKDWKKGILLGLAALPFIAVWIATRPELNTANRLVSPDSVSEKTKPVMLLCPPVRLQEEKKDIAPAAPQEDIKETLPPKTTAGQKPPAKELLVPVEIKPAVHIVTAGQTLSEISKHYYGSSANWQKILNANRDVIKKPKDLKAGMKLVIPR